MRIAFFTETFLPKIDGIVNTLCRLLEHLEAGGHSALLFAPQGGPEEYAGTPIIGLPGLRFPIYRELTLAAPAILSKPLTFFAPHVVHVLNPVSLGVGGLAWARLNRVPAVASYHTDVPGFAEYWGLGWAGPILWSYFRTLHNLADSNLAPSAQTRAQLLQCGFRRVKIWGRGVDTARFSPSQRDDTWRQRLTDGQTDSLLLLYAGRVSPEKRIDWLRPVLARLPGVRLAIVGDGPQRAELAALFAGTRTLFTGYLRGDDLARAYAAADCFVFPGANETLGNVVLEAMASGLPVVVPDQGGQLDHVVHGRQGLLFKHDSVDSLVDSVLELAASPQLRTALGSEGRRYAESQTWNDVLDGLLAHYEALIARHARLERFDFIRQGAPQARWQA
jgi:phosphatidylinositol alpha 1,6-mannosyltransferase